MVFKKGDDKPGLGFGSGGKGSDKESDSEPASGKKEKTESKVETQPDKDQKVAEEKAERPARRPEPLSRPAAAPQLAAAGIEPFARAVIQSNKEDFLRAARSQRFAFATMKWMFLVVFLIALGAMITAIRIATDLPDEGYNWAQAGVVGGVAALAVLLFALLLYMKPMAALERNAVVSSFLTVVVNSYWTRLLYADEAQNVDVYLEDATAYTVEHLGSLLDRQILGASRFMDLVRRAQDEAHEDPGAYGTPL